MVGVTGAQVVIGECVGIFAFLGFSTQVMANLGQGENAVRLRILHRQRSKPVISFSRPIAIEVSEIQPPQSLERSRGKAPRLDQAAPPIIEEIGIAGSMHRDFGAAEKEQKHSRKCRKPPRESSSISLHRVRFWNHDGNRH
jgi:hypothetical protein